VLEADRWADRFQHEARFYSGLDEFLAATVPFTLEGLGREEPVLVAVPQPNRDALRAELRADLDRVVLIDLQELGRNPACIIPAWRDFLRRNGDGARPVRGVGEPTWSGHSPDELVEYQRHETLLNVAFADSGTWKLLCTYDVDALPGDALAEAQRSHPWLSDGLHSRHGSDDCVALDSMAEPFAEPLSPVPAGVEAFSFASDVVSAVRTYCGEVARANGLNDDRADDLVLAVHELVSNSIRHAGGRGVVRIWRETDRILCEVEDNGHIDLPLAGRRRPEPDRLGGRGLWMTNQLCDLVQIRTFADGNVIRLHQRLS